MSDGRMSHEEFEFIFLGTEVKGEETLTIEGLYEKARAVWMHDPNDCEMCKEAGIGVLFGCSGKFMPSNKQWEFEGRVSWNIVPAPPEDPNLCPFSSGGCG